MSKKVNNNNNTSKKVNNTANKATETAVSVFTAEKPAPKIDITAFVDSQIAFARNLQEALDSNKGIIYVLGKDEKGKPTVYEVRKNELGTFISEAKELKGSAGRGVKEGLIFNLPKIPFKILLQIITLFRDVCDFMNGDEAMVQLFWDKEKKEYFVICPEQTTTHINVTFLNSKDMIANDKYIYVMDIHSHNTMDAFFSATDDSSEKANRLYGVIGKVNQQVPTYKFRTCNNQHYIPLSIFDIFEIPKMTISFEDLIQEVEVTEANLMFPRAEYPSEWFETIKKGKEERDRIREEARKHDPIPVSHSRTGRNNASKKDNGQLSLYKYGQPSLFNYTNDDFYLGFGSGGTSKKTSRTSKLHVEDEEDYVDRTPYNDTEVDEVEDLAERICDLSLFEFKMLIDLLHDQGLAEQIAEILEKDYGYKF